VALGTPLANRLWIRSSAAGHRAFLAALGRPRAVQGDYLAGLLRRNAQTEYGRAFGFGGIDSVDGYRERVPVTEYEDYEPYVERIASGAGAVLTADEVILFEPTSGTSSGTKFIPYTESLRAEFQSAIAPWIVSLFAERPGLAAATSYWSISPAGSVPDTLGKVRVGFEDDTAYLGRIGRWLARRVMAVPPSVARIQDPDEFRRRTLVHLLADRHLGLISVWSPTFLTLLLDFFLANADEVLERLSRTRPRRVSEIRSLLGTGERKGVFGSIWPSLLLVSCWVDGPCRAYAEAIRDYLPEVEIQGKGLLATEAVVSLPLSPHPDPVLAVTSHFFEFVEASSGATRLADELREGEEYSVIVTTGGGLCRYRLHDRVVATGRIERTPTLRFLGKDNRVADLFGEKLALPHVADCLERAFSTVGVSPGFRLLAPDEAASGRAHYTLFIECDGLDREAASALARGLEALLKENFHYEYARRLRQLGPVRVFLIDADSMPASRTYSAELARRGMRLGDIKPAVLDDRPGWSKLFRGGYVGGDAPAGGRGDAERPNGEVAGP
jgi:hypothetical protein